ncbi:MAG: NAD(P)-binding domain-containing protein [Planctomycetota bacterium]
MKIGCLGYGSMTRALVPNWSSDHDVMIGGRNREKAEGVAAELGVDVGSEPEVVAHTDVVMLATRHEVVFDAIDAAGGPEAFAGKVVLDINNPVEVAGGSFVPKRYDGGSLSEAIAGRLPRARVVKAFNMCQASVWEMDPPVFDGRRLVTMLCGDDEGAKGQIAALIESVGSEPLDIGGLEYAGCLEHAAALVIRHLFSGRDLRTVLNLIMPESKPIA